ncbi:hypothetical protein Tco_1056262 [Tanacetum coccineum]|uniref:Uncharacterized protein n=1 Tax=Tanacetum coccineum TaxID=301880 RepID=A0ABQ5H208_9ASTR
MESYSECSQKKSYGKRLKLGKLDFQYFRYFGILDTMISNAIKKSAGYNYYIAKKKESAKDKIVDEPEEQLNVPKKDVVPKRTRSLIIAKEIVVDLQKGSKASRLESLMQKKQVVAGEGSSNAHNKHYADSDNDSDAILYSSCSEESENETDDADDSDIDLSNDNPQGDDANLLNETTANELMDFMSNPVYTDAQTTSVEMFSDENVHHNANTPQPSSLQAKAKKLMQKAKKNMRKINFKKAVTQKFREYDQKLEALTNFNVSEAFEKISLFTKPSTNTDDLLEMDLKLRLLNIIYLNKSNETHTTHQQLYDTLYDSITLNQDTLNALDAELSFYKRAHDNHDPPNNREGENRKKCRKDVGKPSSKSSSKCSKKLKAIIQKDELTIADLESAGLERLKQQYQNDVKLEYHVDQLKAAMLSEAKWNSDEDDVLSTKEKYTTSITKYYAARYYKQGMEDMISYRWCKETHIYIFEALNGIHHWEDSRIDFFKAEIIRRSDDQEYEFRYADLPRLSLNDVEDMYLLQVHDKLHHHPFKFVKDFNNAILLFIRRVVIQNRVKDIQLGVESYQQTINLTKPMMFFEGIDQRTPFKMTSMHKWVVYLNQHNIKSLMRLSEVKKFYDGTLVKIQENLIDMVTKNKVGKDNKRLKGRDLTDNDVMKSNKIVRKIDQTLKRREQLRRLEEYVGGRPKTVNPRTFVRPIDVSLCGWIKAMVILLNPSS